MVDCHEARSDLRRYVPITRHREARQGLIVGCRDVMSLQGPQNLPAPLKFRDRQLLVCRVGKPVEVDDGWSAMSALLAVTLARDKGR